MLMAMYLTSPHTPPLRTPPDPTLRTNFPGKRRVVPVEKQDQSARPHGKSALQRWVASTCVYPPALTRSHRRRQRSNGHVERGEDGLKTQRLPARHGNAT